MSSRANEGWFRMTLCLMFGFWGSGRRCILCLKLLRIPDIHNLIHFWVLLVDMWGHWQCLPHPSGWTWNWEGLTGLGLWDICQIQMDLTSESKVILVEMTSGGIETWPVKENLEVEAWLRGDDVVASLTPALHSIVGKDCNLFFKKMSTEDNHCFNVFMSWQKYFFQQI